MTTKTTVQKIDLLEAAISKYVSRIDGTWLNLWAKEHKMLILRLEREAEEIYAAQEQIDAIQERAGYEGLALVLPKNYTKEHVKAAADELSYQISGYRS